MSEQKTPTTVMKDWGSGESVFMMVFYPFGSRNEHPEQRGGMHVLEHMVFQGVDHADLQSWADITQQFEPMGRINAMTSHNFVGYWCHVAHDRANEAAASLGHLATCSPLLPPSSHKSEIEVVVRELEEAYDNPSQRSMEEASVTMHGADDPMGWSIGATPEQVRSLTKDTLLELYAASHSRPRAIVLGKNVTEAYDILFDILRKKLAGGQSYRDMVPDRAPAILAPSERLIDSDTKGYHLVLSQVYPAIHLGDHDYYVACIVAKILGSRMGSRLTRKGRENGLVYSVSASVEADADCARLVIATSVQRKEDVDTLVSYISDPPTETDVEQTKQWVAAQRKLAVSTSPMAVADEIVDFLRFRRDMMRGRGYEWEDESKKYQSVTAEEVGAFWKQFLADGAFYRTIVGKST